MTTRATVGLSRTGDDETVTRQQWKWSILASMASYLDAGSIVALGAGLALFQAEFAMNNTAVGTLAAIGPNAIGAALGAFAGGRLGDRLGRKRIYKYDLLVYAAGILCVALAVNAPMLFIGTFVVGVAVGADVPTSLALVGELSPRTARGKLLGLTQIAWNAGPLVVLLLALALSPLGVLGTRIVFLHLFVVAIVTWVLRTGMSESARWTAAAAKTTAVGLRTRDLFRGNNLRALVWTGTIYVFWGLAAGTAGLFTPYMVKTLGAGSQAASVALACVSFGIGAVVVSAVFMPFSDRGHGVRKWLWGVGAVLQVAAYVLFIVLPFTVPVIIGNIVLFAIGGALAGEPFYKVYSQELFPTILRGTAQGLTFGVARMVLGLWSFFVPMLAQTDFRIIAAMLTAFLFISGVVGFFFMPNTAGKSLEQIESERSVPAAT